MPCSTRCRPGCRRSAERTLAKARRKNHVQTLDKLTEQVNGEHRFIEDVPLIVRETLIDDGPAGRRQRSTGCCTPTSTRWVRRRKILLSRYRIVDVARKVVGVGSVGTSCWVILLQGVDNDDPLFLQVKQAQPSVLAPYVSSQARRSTTKGGAW